VLPSILSLDVKDQLKYVNFLFIILFYLFFIRRIEPTEIQSDVKPQQNLSSILRVTGNFLSRREHSERADLREGASRPYLQNGFQKYFLVQR